MEHNFDQQVAWEIVRDGTRLEQVARELMDVRQFGHDVETSAGFQPWHGAQIVGRSFAWRQGNGQMRAVYLPTRHRPSGALLDDLTQLDPGDVKQAIQPALEGYALKIGHNYKFDIQHERAEGINVAGPVCDTMIACKLIDERHKNYELVQCLKRAQMPHEVGWKKQVDQELINQARHQGTSKKILLAQNGYATVPIQTLGRYTCQDAAYELKLGEWALPQQSPWQDTWNVEMELLWVVLRMEERGVPLNVEHLMNLARDMRATLAQLEPKIWQLAGEQFDLSKDDDQRYILYEKLKLPVHGETKKAKKPSVDDDALWQLERDGAEIAGLIRQWNSADKILSTYSETLAAKVDARGLLHTEIDQCGAGTGRTSSRNPNLQNIPIRSELGRRVREAFIARDGWLRFAVDYSQVELRTVAHLSQDPLLLRIYREGLDAHRTTALEVFGTADKVDGIDMRRIAKVFNFGTTYGMTPVGAMHNINKDLPSDVKPLTYEKAEEYQQQFYAKYLGIDQYRRNLWHQIRMSGGLFWNMFGRPRRMPEISARSDAWRHSAERRSIASMVQGSAADMMKRAMIVVDRYLEEQEICEAMMVLMIHDDIQIDARPEGSARMIRDVKQTMEQVCQAMFSVPIVADIEWFDTHWQAKKEMRV